MRNLKGEPLSLDESNLLPSSKVPIQRLVWHALSQENIYKITGVVHNHQLAGFRESRTCKKTLVVPFSTLPHARMDITVSGINSFNLDAHYVSYLELDTVSKFSIHNVTRQCNSSLTISIPRKGVSQITTRLSRWWELTLNGLGHANSVQPKVAPCWR